MKTTKFVRMGLGALAVCMVALAATPAVAADHGGPHLTVPGVIDCPIDQEQGPFGVWLYTVDRRKCTAD